MTRKLGIEFERRVNTMIPETQIVSKLNTNIIYSYLNQYQDKFINDIYRSLDSIETPSKPSAFVESILRGLVCESDIEAEDTKKRGYMNICSYKLPTNPRFGLYLSSSTRNGDEYSTNKLISLSKVKDIFGKSHDSMRIMREPIAYIDNDNIKVIYDRYTTPGNLNITYYKFPKHMSIPGNDGACELPDEAFEILVSGAVDLYVQYAAGAEARKRQMNEQVWRQNRKEGDNDRN